MNNLKAPPSAACNTSLRCAPRATRIPNSRRRLLTEYDATPKMPVMDSIPPIAPVRRAPPSPTGEESERRLFRPTAFQSQPAVLHRVGAVVLDASTLILIAKADLLDLFLTSINVPVAMPSEVEKECCGFKKALDAIIIQKALDGSRIKVFALRNRRLVAKFQTDFSLGKGEAIVLALDEKAQIVVIDDKNGIDACKVLRIAFTTAVGILVQSREKGLLEWPDASDKLASLAKHGRYKHSIVEDARLNLEAKR